MPDPKTNLPVEHADHSRRRALGVIAGAGLAASALILPERSLAADGGKQQREPGKHKQDEHEVTANEDLMREHGVLRRILVIYDEVASKLVASAAGVDARAIASAAMLFRDFGERYHEQMLEERHIFPLVRKAGGKGADLIDTLLAQHERGRAITGYILDRTKRGNIATGDGKPLARSMHAFTRMYEAHAAREDTLVFPDFKSSVGQKAYEELGEQFEEIEHKQFGGDGFDIALDKVADIELALGLQSLASFTAPPPPAG